MQILVDTPLLALLVVMAVGMVLGQIKIGGFKLGVAAVLFVGLGLATIEPAIELPHIVYIIGLAVFVYTIGLESGPGFFRSLRSTGIKHNLFGLLMLSGLAALGFLVITATGINRVEGAGMFTGALTNTPALSAVVESLPGLFDDPAQLAKAQQMPVIGYSLAYPIGVLGVILAIAVLNKVFKIDHDQEALDAGVASLPLSTQRIRVDRDDLPSVAELPGKLGRDITISRIEHHGRLFVPELDDSIERGDVLAVVGTEEETHLAAEQIGELIAGDPTEDVRLEYRRIFVSNPDVVGIPLQKLYQRHPGMVITRIRRGDRDEVASPEMTLRLGDRVRVVVRSGQLSEVSAFFGDSYKRLADVNLATFILGMAIGVLIGMIEIPMPGGTALKLGSAGGPLVVALILGALGRTGPVVWQMPYSANLAFRELGLALFLAGIGTTAGAGFKAALSDPASLTVLGLAAVIALSSAFFTIIIGHKVLKIPFGQVTGILAGLQTHPAVLTFTNDTAKNELPSMGYTSVYPMAMIAKIILAQVLIVALI